MSFVTRLTFQSGDRVALEAALADIKAAAERKGVEFKGPHAHPPEEFRVPQYKTVAAEDAFEAWGYTVYERQLDIVGYEDFAREVAGWDLPSGIHISAEVEQVSGMG
jgi:small subunit ribosomal protein S10